MKVLKECVAVLGLTVVGALMPTVVKANVALTFKQGDLNNDRYRDPGSDYARVNSGSTCSTWYTGCSVKKVKPVWIILMIIVASILCAVFGILK